jgi:hypothetical protein
MIRQYINSSKTSTMIDNVIKVNRHGDLISGSVNGVPFSVTYSEKKWQLMKELEEKAKNAKTIQELQYYVAEFNVLTKEDYGDFVETRCPFIKVNKDNNRFYLQYEGVISNRAMPNSFAQKIIKAVDKDLDVLPIVKNWVRFLHNPNYTDTKAQKYADYISAPYTNYSQVRELTNNRGLNEVMAIEFSTTSQVAMTLEGLLVCYKASDEITNRFRDKSLPPIPPPVRLIMDKDTNLVKYDDTKYAEHRIFEPAVQHQSGDAFYCGNYLGHIIKVGQVHRLPSWSNVDCNDSRSGAPGLHVGGLRYIRGYQGSGTVTHNVLVDPMHIGAIVGLGDGNDGAMRVLQYFVLNAFDGVNSQLYNSSRYAQLTDVEYGAMIKRATNL